MNNGYKFAVVDEVIVNGKRSNENQYAYYLDGSIGIVTELPDRYRAYKLNITDRVDAHPDEREKRHYGLGWLISNGAFSEKELEFVPEANKDDGFEEVFL